jgi:hypothetical protein
MAGHRRCRDQQHVLRTDLGRTGSERAPY